MMNPIPPMSIPAQTANTSTQVQSQQLPVHEPARDQASEQVQGQAQVQGLAARMRAQRNFIALRRQGYQTDDLLEAVNQQAQQALKDQLKEFTSQILEGQKRDAGDLEAWIKELASLDHTKGSNQQIEAISRLVDTMKQNLAELGNKLTQTQQQLLDQNKKRTELHSTLRKLVEQAKAKQPSDTLPHQHFLYELTTQICHSISQQGRK